MKKYYSVIIAAIIGLAFFISCNSVLALEQDKQASSTSRDSSDGVTGVSDSQLSALEKRLEQARQETELVQ
jgi:hypothetical protein